MRSSPKVKNRSLIGDVLIASVIFMITALLLELNRPGLVSALIDINIMVIVVMLSFVALVVVPGACIVQTRQRISYIAVFIGIDMYLMFQHITLQANNLLLGLVLAVLLTLVLSLSLYVVTNSKT